jgi:hypothetical protein
MKKPPAAASWGWGERQAFRRLTKCADHSLEQTLDRLGIADHFALDTAGEGLDDDQLVRALSTVGASLGMQAPTG